MDSQHSMLGRTYGRKYSLAVRVVEPWNQLPDSIKYAESKEAFKRALKLRKKIVAAKNSPAGRLINDECSGEEIPANHKLDVSATLLHGELDSTRQVTSK